MTKRKSSRSPRASRGKERTSRISARAPEAGKEGLLSPEWIREIKRRVRYSRDPIRYMLVSEFSRKFRLYYDVSSDVFVMNAPEKGTLFKRREAAERVKELLSRGVHVVKFTTAGGKLKRLSPFKGMRYHRSKQPNPRSNRRAASVVATSDVTAGSRSRRH